MEEYTFRDEKGDYHRIGGPALVLGDKKYWYKHGQFHREDGPAVILPGRYNAWLIDGRLHRLDGPAIEYDNGRFAWWIDDKNYTEEDFKKYISEMIPQETRQLTL